MAGGRAYGSHDGGRWSFYISQWNQEEFVDLRMARQGAGRSQDGMRKNLQSSGYQEEDSVRLRMVGGGRGYVSPDGRMWNM